MSPPKGKDEDRGSRVALLAGVALAVAVVGVVAATGALVTLELRRGEVIRDLEAQLESLRHLVEAMGQQLEHHDRLINTTLHAKNSFKSEPAEEVVYENDYDYDDEDEYEYEEEDERNTKTKAKRTAVLSKNNSSEEQGRHKRQIDVHEESTPYTTEQQSRPVHLMSKPHSLVYQERRPEEVRYRHKNSRARSRQANERETSVEYSRERFTSESLSELQSHIVAAHFTGDTSRYNQRDHAHYHGNHIISHPHKLIKDWSPAQWMTEENKKYFPIQDGKLEIQMSGLYFVYAQVFFSSNHHQCGFHITHNGNDVAQCSTFATGVGLKRNTCHTSLLLRLGANDLLWIKEVEGQRNTSFKDSHSFFGLFKLGAT